MSERNICKRQVLYSMCATSDITESLNTLAHTILEQGEYVQMIQIYAKALKHNHQLAAAYFGRGIAYSELVQNQRPLGSFDEYVRLAPNDTDGYEY